MTVINGTPGTSVAASVTGPNFGKSPIASADVNGPFESIVNDIATVKKILGFGIEQAMNAVWLVNGATIANGSLAMSTIPASDTGVLLLVLPHMAKVRTFKVRVAPGAHGGVGATVTPKLTYFKVSLTGVIDPKSLNGTWTATDTVPLPAYDTPHDLVLDLGSYDTIDRTAYVYYLLFTQETGGNEKNGDVGQPRVALS